MAHDLLQPVQPTPEGAVQACRAYLARRWRRFGLAARLLPGDRRDDLIALLAWHALVREMTGAATGDTDLRAALADLSRTLEGATSSEPNNPMAAALRPALAYHELSALALRGVLEEHRRSEHVHTFDTRAALLQHARRLNHGEVQSLLHVLGRTSEREELLAENLGLGLRLTDWIVRLPRDVERGQVNVAIEDLARHGLDVLSLGTGAPAPALRGLLADMVAWARELLLRGWPLCDSLGPWRGRQLAFVLRWHAATLSALEARRFEPRAAPPPAGWPRLAACVAWSLATRGAPRL